MSGAGTFASRPERDGEAVTGLLATAPPTECLQAAGPAPLALADMSSPRVSAVAERCIAALGERAWVGDEQLAQELEAGLGDAPEEADGIRWAEVWPEGHAGRDLRAFLATVDHPDVVDRLERALGGGRGAFRRFRNELDRWPHEASRWHAFTDDRRAGRARAWLAEAGYRADPTSPAER